METQKKITAICGWALPQEWFGNLVSSYFPEAEVHAYYPENPGSEVEALQVLGKEVDWVIGYSLGSLWLLTHKKTIHPHTRIALLAPILAFPAEKKLGGTTPLAKLKYQKKMLAGSEEYATSLRGFFELSGIRLPDNDLQQPYSRETLIKGLDFLESASVAPQAASDCIALTGLRDSLLDGNRLKQLIPHLTLVKAGDHSPHKLLAQLALEMVSSPTAPPISPQQTV